MTSNDFGFVSGMVTDTIFFLEMIFSNLNGANLLSFFLTGITLKASSNSPIIFFALSAEELVPIRIPISCFHLV